MSEVNELHNLVGFSFCWRLPLAQITALEVSNDIAVLTGLILRAFQLSFIMAHIKRGTGLFPASSQRGSTLPRRSAPCGNEKHAAQKKIHLREIDSSSRMPVTWHPFLECRQILQQSLATFVRKKSASLRPRPT